MLGTLCIISATTCLALVPSAWARRGNTTAAGWLVCSLLGLAGWALTVALQSRDRFGLPPDLLEVAPFLPITVCVVGLYGMCRSLAEPTWAPSMLEWVLLGIELLLGVVVVATDAGHQLLTGGGSSQGPGFGVLFTVHGVFGGALVLSALARVVAARRVVPAHRSRQLDLVLASVIIGLAADAVFVTGLTGSVDYTPVAFVVTGLLQAYAVLRLGLLELVPVARERVLESLSDGVLVLDASGRLVDLNAAAGALATRVSPAGTGDIFDAPEEALGALGCVLGGTERRYVTAGSRGPMHLDVARSPLMDRRGRPQGQVVLLRDVSEAEAQRSALLLANDTLSAQLRTIESLQAELAEQTRRDVLTGLHNRRHLVAVLPEILDSARATGSDLSVVVIDVDHFKRVNDTFGHAVGDEMLVAVADCVRASVRAEDLVVRWGGEEFVVLLPGLASPDALQRAWSVCRACHALCTPDGTAMTLSAGVATAATHTTPDELLARADEALYVAKREGRNRVVPAVAV